MKAKLQRLIAYGTGAVALVIVAAAAGSAITYAVMHGTETLTHLGNSALQGIGMAIGGCLGSALVLRFKVARKYVKNVLNEIHRGTPDAQRRRNRPQSAKQPINPAVQELLATIPEYDPRRRMLDEFQKKWTRTPPEPDKDHPCVRTLHRETQLAQPRDYCRRPGRLSRGVGRLAKPPLH